MIGTVDVLLGGKSFVVAFASTEDAERFIAFAEQHSRECPASDPALVYRLDPQWCIGQYNHRPLYAHWGLQEQPVLQMILGLLEARLIGAMSVVPMPPTLDMRPSKEKGTTFQLTQMPPSRQN